MNFRPLTVDHSLLYEEHVGILELLQRLLSLGFSKIVPEVTQTPIVRIAAILKYLIQTNKQHLETDKIKRFIRYGNWTPGIHMHD